MTRLLVAVMLSGADLAAATVGGRLHRAGIDDDGAPKGRRRRVERWEYPTTGS
jgi:hypothetical protein